MKTTNLFIILMLLFASSTSVHFIDPQPASLDELDVIPEKFQGTFYRASWNDTTIYVVTESSVSENDEKFYSIDSNLIVKGYGNSLYLNSMSIYGYECRLITIVDYLDYENIVVKVADIPNNFDNMEEITDFNQLDFFKNLKYSILNEKGEEVSDLEDFQYMVVEDINMNQLHSFFNHQPEYKLTRVK